MNKRYVKDIDIQIQAIYVDRKKPTHTHTHILEGDIRQSIL